MFSKFIYHRTTVELGVITNAFLQEMMTADPDTPATITLGVFMHWEDHEYHEQGAVLPVTVIGEWGQSGRWSDTIDYTTELDTDPDLTTVSSFDMMMTTTIIIIIIITIMIIIIIIIIIIITIMINDNNNDNNNNNNISIQFNSIQDLFNNNNINDNQY